MPDVFSDLPYFRMLFVAISRHYDIDAVIEELIKMGWKESAYKLTPEVIERSIKEMTNWVLHGASYPTGDEE